MRILLQYDHKPSVHGQLFVPSLFPSITCPNPALTEPIPVLEALRFDCHFRTPTGTSFAISPARIFTQELLPSTNPSSTGTPKSGGVKNLTLVIALPILGFVILVCGTTLCCFFFIRWRRKRARKQRQSSHLYARWNDTTISTPSRGDWDPQYGMGQGFGFADNDGREQDVGFAKPGFVEVTEPAIPLSNLKQEKGVHDGYYGGFSHKQ